MGQHTPKTPPRRTGTRKPRPKRKWVEFWAPPEVVAYVEQVMAEYGLSQAVVCSHMMEHGLALMEAMPPETLRRYLAGTMPPEEIRRYLKRGNGKTDAP